MEKNGSNYTGSFGPSIESNDGNQENQVRSEININQDNQNVQTNTQINVNEEEKNAKQGQDSNIRISKREFYKKYIPDNQHWKIQIGPILAYIIAGVTLATWGVLFATGYYDMNLENKYMYLDSCFALGMGLGWHLGRSRACATIFTASFLITKVTQLFLGEISLSSSVATILSIGLVVSTVSTYKAYSLWKYYLKTGITEKQVQ